MNILGMKLSVPAFLLLFLLPGFASRAQDANNLLKKVKDKQGLVSDYEAEGIMKTDVAFMKVRDLSHTW